MTEYTLTGYQRADEIRKSRENQFAPDDPNQLGLIIEEIHARAANTKREMLLKGELMIKAKEFVGHGNFKQWIEENFDFS